MHFSAEIDSSAKDSGRLVQFSLFAQSCPTLCDPMDCRRQASLSITNSRSLCKLISIDLVMPSNYLILCRPLLLPSIFPDIRVFSNKSVLRIRWLKYWISASTSVLSGSLQPHEPQHTRSPCLSPTPGVHPNPCPLSQ